MDKCVWLYRTYGAKHPVRTEVILILIAAVIVHLGLAYVKATAAKYSMPVVSQQQLQNTPTVTTYGANSPAITGDQNSINYDSSGNKEANKESKGSK